MSDSWGNLSRTTTKFLIKPDWQSSPDMDFDFNREVVAFAGTSIELYNLNNNVDKYFTYKYTNLGKDDEYEITRFFNGCQGKLKRFWLPNWKNSFVLVQNIVDGDNVITVRNTYFRNIDQGQERIFFELKDGSMISRRILAVIENGEYEDFILETYINQNILITDIKYFGRLFLVRFDQDELNMSFVSDSHSQCELSFKELSNEYEEEFVES